jgi:tRNA A-37 threonylcarbamoyl transferase component Bud32
VLVTGAELDGIRAGIAAWRYRTQVVETGDGRVVVKRQRPARGAWRAHAVNLFARLFGLRLLQAVPAHGGAKGQAIEVERLQRLAAAGVRVPTVLHVDPAFVVIEHFEGTSLVELVEAGGAAGFDAWQSGLAALVELHGRGGYLSHAFARNFIATDAGLAMIDFEDDPLEAMSVDEAQARDWLAYLHSTAWLLQRHAPALASAVASHLARERSAVRDLVAAAGGRLAVLRHLPRSRRTWGREVVGVQALASLFPLQPLRA